jgi:hypothetical protein
VAGSRFQLEIDRARSAGRSGIGEKRLTASPSAAILVTLVGIVSTETQEIVRRLGMLTLGFGTLYYAAMVVLLVAAIVAFVVIRKKNQQ